MEKYNPGKMNIILAAGTQTRWNTEKFEGIPEIKQLVEVDGKILIEKIQEQFEDSIVITNDKEISAHSKKVLKPENSEVTVSTLFSTHQLWYDWTTILLGDVLYGGKTVDKIHAQKEGLMFYGDKGEIYAIKWHPDLVPFIHFAINKLVTHKEWTPKFGKLWNLYRVINGIDFREHKIDKYFTFVSDCMDFDNQKRYLEYAKNKKVRK